MTSREGPPILIVDDDDAMRRTLHDVLELGGYAPADAADGASALAAAGRSTPSVAIVDLRLPDMDGLDLAVRLQELDERIQVVILTGNASVETAVRALRDQGCDYLVKPVRPDDLLRTVHNAESRWRLREAEDDLRETQVLLGALFDASPLPLVVVDAEFEVRLWNAAAERVFGWLGSEVFGKRLPIFEDDQADEAKSILRQILDGRLVTGLEVQRRRKDGSMVDLRLSGAPLTDAHGVTTAALAVYEDITAQRQTEMHLAHVQRLDALGRLAGGIAHDFNNVIAVIRSEMDLVLAEDELPEGIRDNLTGVRRNADRGAAITRQLLTFARREPMASEVIEVNTVVADLERMLQRLIGDGIRMVVRLDTGAGSVNVDRGKLEQVLTNLVVNARDAIAGTGRITISTRNERVSPTRSRFDLDQGEWVVISVADTGSGIPEHLRSRIFEPFFSTKAAGQGTGLGLATSHGIVQGMGGVLSVESEVDKGSTFHVCLPRAAQRGATERADDSAEMPVGNEVVLLVEDHTELLDVTRRILVRLGYTVYTAVDGNEAWSVLDEMGRAPDLLLTDAHLPTGDGRDLIERFRERFPDLKVLLTSGSFELAERDQVDVPFIGKPYTLDSLAVSVRNALDGRDRRSSERQA